MRAPKPPRDDDACGWWNVLPSPPPARRLTADTIADCVVVGAGFTGLAIARQLAVHRPGWQIALVEGQRAGYGASGRNSGFAGAITHLDPTRGIEEALRLGRLCRAGIGALHSVVREHGIACDWTECGRIHAAAEDHGLRNLERLVRILEAAGEAHEMLDRPALAVALGTDHYQAGVHIASTVLLQPAALARGLSGALPENVTLYEESPVRRIQRQDRWRVDADEGAVRADRVFLAVNGYAAELGILRRRVFPLLTFASWTRPLAVGEQAQVGNREQWGLVAEDRMGTTLRRTRDGRILVRSVVRFAPSLRVAERDLAQIRAKHQRSLRTRWPGLEDVEFEFSWGGVLGMTLNQGQFFGRLGPELYASLGYNGTGVAMGTASGMLLADYALSADSALLGDALALPRPAWLPPQPFLGWGVRSTVAFLRRRAGAER
jgi:glycine/D-amino acid oxidase-like deaminating enzyme